MNPQNHSRNESRSFFKDSKKEELKNSNSSIPTAWGELYGRPLALGSQAVFKSFHIAN